MSLCLPSAMGGSDRKCRQGVERGSGAFPPALPVDPACSPVAGTLPGSVPAWCPSSTPLFSLDASNYTYSPCSVVHHCCSSLERLFSFVDTHKLLVPSLKYHHLNRVEFCFPLEPSQVALSGLSQRLSEGYLL